MRTVPEANGTKSAREKLKDGKGKAKEQDVDAMELDDKLFNVSQDEISSSDRIFQKYWTASAWTSGDYSHFRHPFDSLFSNHRKKLCMDSLNP